MCREVKVALLFRKGVEGVSDTLMEEVGKCVMYWIGKYGKEERICCLGS